MISRVKLYVIVFVNIITINIKMCTASDFCKIQRERCPSYRPHIGCAENGFKFLGTTFRTAQISNDDREVILVKFNRLKNDYASGGKPFIPSATQVSEIKWSDSLENLAKISVRLKPASDVYPCYLIDGFSRVLDFTYSDKLENITDSEAIQVGVESRLQYIGRYGESLTDQKDDIKWFARDFALTTDIGCGYLKSEDLRVLKCLYNVGSEKDITYDAGPAATKCEDIHQRASGIYPALCETPPSIL